VAEWYEANVDDLNPLVPLLAVSTLVVEAVFVGALGLLLIRGLLRPEVRAYLHEE